MILQIPFLAVFAVCRTKMGKIAASLYPNSACLDRPQLPFRGLNSIESNVLCPVLGYFRALGFHLEYFYSFEQHMLFTASYSIQLPCQKAKFEIFPNKWSRWIMLLNEGESKTGLPHHAEYCIGLRSSPTTHICFVHDPKCLLCPVKPKILHFFQHPMHLFQTMMFSIHHHLAVIQTTA